MIEKKSKEIKTTKTNQKEFNPVDKEFDFLLWFCFWEKNMLLQLSIDAYTFYYDMENAIDKEGNLKPGYIEKISDIHSRYEEKTNFKDIFLYADIVAEKDFSNAETLLELAILCQLASNNIDQRFKTKNKEEIMSFVMSDWILTEATNRAIAYLAAKQEKKNPGAEAMKKRHNKNVQAISELLENMKINDTGIFRADKTKRELFFNKAKETTSLTSEDRIFRLLRADLKKKKSKS